MMRLTMPLCLICQMPGQLGRVLCNMLHYVSNVNLYALMYFSTPVSKVFFSIYVIFLCVIMYE